MRKLPIICVISTATVSLVWANSTTLNPDLDNTLIQTTDGSLSNGLGDIYVGRTNQSDSISRRRGVLRFDIAGSIPSGSTINSVTLRLWLFRVSDSSVRTVYVHPATASWGEGSSYTNGGAGSASASGDATWLHRFFSGTSWTSTGGDYNGTASGSASIGSAGDPAAWYTWSTTAMKNDVQGWLTTPASNYGWVVIGDESTNQTARRFTSREAADDVGSHYPELIVDYTPPPSLTGGAPAPSKAATLGGLRVLGERDLDGDGVLDLVLRDEHRGMLLGGHATPKGLTTWELALDHAPMDPLGVLPAAPMPRP
jgi:hypothetical protein